MKGMRILVILCGLQRNKQKMKQMSLILVQERKKNMIANAMKLCDSIYNIITFNDQNNINLSFLNVLVSSPIRKEIH